LLLAGEQDAHFRFPGVPARDTARIAGFRRELAAAQEARRAATLAAAGLDRHDTANPHRPREGGGCAADA